MHTTTSLRVARPGGRRDGTGWNDPGYANLVPARRGFFGRLRDLILGRSPGGMSMLSSDDPISTLRPATESGVIARLTGRIQGLDERQTALASSLLASIRTQTPAIANPGAQAGSAERQTLEGLAKRWGREWPDQVFDRVSHELRSNTKLKQDLQRELQRSAENPAALTRSIAKAMGDGQGRSFQTQSRAQACMAAVLTVLGDEKAAQQLRDLHHSLEALAAEGQRPIGQRIEAAHDLLRRTNGAAMFLRTKELDAFRTQVQSLIHNLRGLSGAKAGELTHAIGSLGDASRPLAARIEASSAIGSDLARSGDVLDPVELASLRKDFDAAIQILGHACNDIGTQALALSDSLDKPQDGEALTRARARLTDFQIALTLHDQLTLSSGERLPMTHEDAAIKQQSVDWASRRLAALERPPRVLDRLSELAAERKHASCAELIKNINSLKPADYLRVSLRLQTLVEGMDVHRTDECLLKLAEAAKPQSSVTAGPSRNDAFLTTFVAALTEAPPLLAAMLTGAGWRGAVSAFRLAVIDELEQGVQIKDSVSMAAADKFAGSLEDERIKVDAQHHQAVASDLLDEAFSVTGIEKSLFARASSSRGPLLSAFRALVPSASLIKALFGGALPKGFAQQFDMQILEWVRLSQAAGLIAPKDLDELYNAFPPGTVTAMGRESALQLARQGFRSTQEVLDCTRSIKEFARAVAASNLVMKAGHAQRPLAQADYVVRALFKKVTGNTLTEIDEQMISDGLKGVLNPQVDQLADFYQPLSRSDLKSQRNQLIKDLKLKEMLTDGSASPFQKMAGKLRSRAAPKPLGKGYEKLKDLVDYLDAANTLAGPSLSDTEITAASVKRDQSRQKLAGFSVKSRSFASPSSPESLRVPEDEELRELLPLRTKFQRLRSLQIKIKNYSATSSVPSDVPKEAVERLWHTLEDSLKIATLLAAINGKEPQVEGDSLVKTTDAAPSPVMQTCKRLGLDDALFASSRAASQVWEQESNALSQAAGAYKDLGPLPDFVAKWNPDAGSFFGKTKEKVALAILPEDVEASARVQSELSRQIAQSFERLQPGASFGIRLGIYGENSFTQPVLPGAGIEFTGGMESAGEITVLRRGDAQDPAVDSFEVTIAHGKTARLGISLKVFRDLLALGLDGSTSNGSGLKFQFRGANTCQDMVQSLLQGAQVNPLEWQAARIDRFTTSGQSGRVAVSTEAALHEALIKARASVHGEIELQSELIRQGNAVVEVLTQRRAALGEAQLSGAMGRLDIAGERGRDRKVTRRLVREGGELKPGSELLLASRVVNGDVQAALRDVAPDLPEAAIAQLAGTIGQVDASSQVMLRCRLTPAAMSDVNKHLRAAWSALIDATLQADCVAREQVRGRAITEAAAAEKLLQEPSSYRAESLLVREAGASRQEGLPVPMRTQFAESREARVRVIALPSGAADAGEAMTRDGSASLTSHYSRWLALAPSSQA